MALFPIFDPPVKVVCASCSEEISGLRVKCAECANIELCLQCFSGGAELGAHKNDHSYRFVETDAADVFKNKIGWTANEELLLLNGIEEFGFGNWEDISNHIETRTPEEAKEEYFARFVDGAIGEATWPRAFEKRAKFVTCIDHTGTLDSNVKTEPGLDNDNGENGEESYSMSTQTNLDQFPAVGVSPELFKQLGYMPRRDDFDREYENDAESIIANINFGDFEGDELETALVLSQADIYLQKLRERHKRKFIIKEHQLVAQFFNSLKESRVRHRHICHEQIELEEELKWLCQFHSFTEHEGFIESLMRQKHLERRLAELTRYRKAGVRTYEEAAHYEQERLVREVTETGSEEADGSETGSGGDSPAHQGSSGFPMFFRSFPVNHKPKSPIKKKKKTKRQLFSRKKMHLPHRLPHIIARNRAAAKAAAAAAAAAAAGLPAPSSP